MELASGTSLAAPDSKMMSQREWLITCAVRISNNLKSLVYNQANMTFLSNSVIFTFHIDSLK
jgi:hypothetical protein